ncbi:Uncharacterized protein TCM_036357 [Theobroma cacao]|uniref:Uncharacterized protein n=1 Tax=Theobroma cacao TaxID=3641 RepID=A0A061FRT2_THECC|nr:Uncharacterized protein TCM_036357 [Theobroma cacao]
MDKDTLYYVRVIVVKIDRGDWPKLPKLPGKGKKVLVGKSLSSENGGWRWWEEDEDIEDLEKGQWEKNLMAKNSPKVGHVGILELGLGETGQRISCCAKVENVWEFVTIGSIPNWELGVVVLVSVEAKKVDVCKKRRGRVSGVDSKYSFGNVYVLNDKGHRREVWGKLVEAVGRFDVLWCLGGDFNGVRNEKEMIGKSDIDISSTHFKEFINDVMLQDLPLLGAKFTWCSNRNEVAFNRLNRFLVDYGCLVSFNNLV